MADVIVVRPTLNGANKNRLVKRVAGPDALIYRLNGSLRLMTLLKQSWLDGQDADTLLQGKKGEGLRGLLRFTRYYSRGPISEKAMPIARPIPIPIPMLSMNRPITTPIATSNATPRPRLDFFLAFTDPLQGRIKGATPCSGQSGAT